MNIYIIVIVLLIFILSIKRKRVDAGQLYDRFRDRFSVSPSRGSLPRHVDQVYCIRSEKRHKYITEVMDNYGLQVTYLDAIFPKDLEPEDYATFGSRGLDLNVLRRMWAYQFWYMINRKSAVPVQVSHALCFLHAMKHGYKTIMIFEDDVKFDVDFGTVINEFHNSPLDVLYLGYCGVKCSTSAKNASFKHLIETDKKVLCTHALVVKTHFVQGYLDSIFPMSYPEDVYFNNYCHDNGVRVAIPKKSCVRQNLNQESLNSVLAPMYTGTDCKFG